MRFKESRPRWGIVELVLVYLGILFAGLIFSATSEKISRVLNLIGFEDSIMVYFMVGFTIQFLATIGMVLIFTVFINKTDLKALGFKSGKKHEYIKYGLIGGIFLVILISILGYPINYLKPDLKPQVFEEVLRSANGFPQFGLLLITGAVLAPFSEELFYRAMIYPVFRGYIGPLWGAIISGLIFGLAHWDIWRALPLAIGGMILCYLYEKTGNIFVPTLAHGIWNGTMALVLYLNIIGGST